VARIFIVGSGVVGTATGRGLARVGHAVTFVDVDPERVAALRAEGRDAVRSLDLRDQPDAFVFLTLPTPHHGHAYDLTALRQGARAVGEAIAQADRQAGDAGAAHTAAVHTVVVRSTVPPGTTAGVVQPILEECTGRAEGTGFALAANPEFLRAACADEDFRWPWMTVVGASRKRTAERLADLLRPFGGQLRVFDRPETAELVKCAHNIYNATKISFWNEMWLVATELGLDHDEVAGTVAASAEASTNPLYGIRGGAPYGGACLPKDTQGFLGFATELGVTMPLLSAVVEVNDRLAAHVATELDTLDTLDVGVGAFAGARKGVLDLRRGSDLPVE